MTQKSSLLFVFLISFLTISCSSDNDNTSNNGSSGLLRVEQLSYDNGTLDEKIIIDYSNDKPNLWSFYDNTDQLTYSSTWEYSNSGLLTAIKGYLPNGTLNTEFTITYDSNNRIIKTVNIEDNNSYITTTDFTYNNDNTITSTSDVNGNVSNKTFEINANGIIDKEINNGNVTVMVQYNDLIPVSKTTYGTYITTYSYQSNGAAPLAFQSLFDNKPINVVLFQNSLDDAFDTLTIKLISSVTNSTNSTTTFEYTLNTQNYPLTRKEYYNGTLTDELFYVYE